MITSVTNQKVKRVVQLNKKSSQRKKEGVFVVEGIKMFLEAPKEQLEEVYVSEDYLREMEESDLSTEEVKGTVQDERGSTEALREQAIIKLKDCGYEVVSQEVFSKMSDTQTPQGVLCVLRQARYTISDILQKEEAPLFLVLENLQDPGNLGTIMRTGEGAGISGVIMSRETVDIHNPKTIRATMGSVYRVPFLYVDDLHETIRKMKAEGVSIYAAHLKGVQNYDECDYKKPTAFLIGNEGNGLTDATAALADTYIRIPMEGRLESLNAAVAAAILMYEGARQRRK